MFLSALACVAFAGSAFASSEVVENSNSTITNSNNYDFDKVCVLRVKVKSNGVYYYYTVFVTIPDNKNCSDFTAKKDTKLAENEDFIAPL